MKRIAYLLFITLTAASCKKFLDVQPDLQIDESRALNNAGSAETALNGLYNRLGDNGYYGSNFQALSYLSGGDIKWTGSQAAPQEVTLHKLSADNGYVGDAWNAIYTTILQANLLVGKVPGITDPVLTEARKKTIVGEALFIRALAYFDLARGWGGVPLILLPTEVASDNENVARSTEAETYAQVLKDLDAAEGLLAETVNRNKVTRKTVWALKARFHLYRQNWEQADAYATLLIKDVANYSLQKPYSSFFANNAANTPESILELAYSNSFKNNHSNWWLPPASGGRREWSPADHLVTLLNTPATGGTRSAAIKQTSAGLWYGNVYYRSPVGIDPSYVLRIAEQYLIRAEARAHQHRTDAALEDLDAVRSRAGLAPSGATSEEDILRAISEERRLEFAFESDRWYDLRRTGRITEATGVADPDRFLFPIPTKELQTNTAIIQNEGY
ncbi:RagB/SusD family nutrient uptake outer membrane protein [Chitinophaga sp.]|uniref:RagB/SusD family nutrient uptake outer membrane protein n=1 Tax=Chitinophaga sp. TaxID=1869181 RepID=UPI0031D28C8F